MGTRASGAQSSKRIREEVVEDTEGTQGRQ